MNQHVSCRGTWLNLPADRSTVLARSCIDLPTLSMRFKAPRALVAEAVVSKSDTNWPYHFFAFSSWPANSWATPSCSRASAVSGGLRIILHELFEVIQPLRLHFHESRFRAFVVWSRNRPSGNGISRRAAMPRSCGFFSSDRTCPSACRRRSDRCRLSGSANRIGKLLDPLRRDPFRPLRREWQHQFDATIVQPAWIPLRWWPPTASSSLESSSIIFCTFSGRPHRGCFGRGGFVRPSGSLEEKAVDIGHFIAEIENDRSVDQPPNIAHFDQRADRNLAVFAIGFDHRHDVFISRQCRRWRRRCPPASMPGRLPPKCTHCVLGVTAF